MYHHINGDISLVVRRDLYAVPCPAVDLSVSVEEIRRYIHFFIEGDDRPLPVVYKETRGGRCSERENTLFDAVRMRWDRDRVRMRRNAHGMRVSRDCHGMRVVRDRDGVRVIRNAHAVRVVRNLYGVRVRRDFDIMGMRLVNVCAGRNPLYRPGRRYGAV